MKDYSAFETAKLLEKARKDASAPKPFLFLNMRQNHVGGGSFDFKVQEQMDGEVHTFEVRGGRMSAAQFGNYIAGYASGYGGVSSYAGMRVGGIIYDYIDGASNWDRDSVFDIDYGMVTAVLEQMGKLSPTPTCDCE